MVHSTRSLNTWILIFKNMYQQLINIIYRYNVFVTCGDTYAHAYIDARTPPRTIVSFSEMKQR